MRVLAVVGLALFVSLLVQPAVSQVPDDKLIVPGVRIGKWTLDMTISALVEMNGPRNGSSMFGMTDPVMRGTVYPGTDWQDAVYLHAWHNVSLFVGTLGENSPQVVFLATFSRDYKTPQGISVGTLPKDVEAAYGTPTANNGARLIYDAIGFSPRVMAGTAVALVIFRPGTAKSIWKY